MINNILKNRKDIYKLPLFFLLYVMGGFGIVAKNTDFRNAKYGPPKPCNITKKQVRGKRSIKIKKYYIVVDESCTKEDIKNESENLGGIVLYLKKENGRLLTEWEENGIKCSTGCIFIKKVTDFKKKKFASKQGVIHGMLYKSIFGTEFNQNLIVGSGFARQNGERKFNSGSIHGKDDEFRNASYVMKDANGVKREMTSLEKKWINKAINNFVEKGQVVTEVDEELFLVEDKKGNCN